MFSDFHSSDMDGTIKKTFDYCNSQYSCTNCGKSDICEELFGGRLVNVKLQGIAMKCDRFNKHSEWK